MNPRKRKNQILKTLTIVAVIGAILSGLALDSETWIPAIVLGICLAWLLLIFWANCPRE